jgi:hypothetical protein
VSESLPKPILEPPEADDRERSIRRMAAKYRTRYPWHGDWFTLAQMEHILLALDAARQPKA